jgi:uncharacterized membrane protein YgaE (UPF0421/DUF939 family)
VLALTIDNPQIENYFANSADKIKEFLKEYVSQSSEYEQFKNTKRDLSNELLDLQNAAKTISFEELEQRLSKYDTVS